ncbi:Hypothetical protein A7982_10269 [Minicystis rosea]|nr:Hypothetical protein A7982_10269 [Minicystis rosea]
MKRGPSCLWSAALLATASCAAPAAGPEAANVVWIEQQARPRASAATPEQEPEPRRAVSTAREGPEPHRFWLLIVGEVSERREWARVDRGTWEERHPSGAVMRYRIIGRLREPGRDGVLARRLPDGDVEVFIPDLGAAAWPAMRVAPEGDWHDLAPMHVIE